MKTILALILFLFAVPSQADWKDNVSDAMLYAAGIATSYVIHEAGHVITARAYGEKLDWNDSFEWKCRPPCEHHDNIAMSGNFATAILGESLLYLPLKYRNSSFVDGMQTFNTANPIVYLYLNERNKNGYGDYQFLDDSYRKHEVALAIHAASVGYRQFSERAWRLMVTPRGVQIRASFR